MDIKHNIETYLLRTKNHVNIADISCNIVLRTVPTFVTARALGTFLRDSTMRRKQNLASALGTQKEN